MNPHVLEFVKLCLFNGTARVRRWEQQTGTAIADTCRAVIPDYNKLLEHSLRLDERAEELAYVLTKEWHPNTRKVLETLLALETL